MWNSSGTWTLGNSTGWGINRLGYRLNFPHCNTLDTHIAIFSCRSLGLLCQIAGKLYSLSKPPGNAPNNVYSNNHTLSHLTTMAKSKDDAQSTKLMKSKSSTKTTASLLVKQAESLKAVPDILYTISIFFLFLF